VNLKSKGTALLRFELVSSVGNTEIITGSLENALNIVTSVFSKEDVIKNENIIQAAFWGRKGKF
jgi:hypothetical protein